MITIGAGIKDKRLDVQLVTLFGILINCIKSSSIELLVTVNSYPNWSHLSIIFLSTFTNSSQIITQTQPNPFRISWLLSRSPREGCSKSNKQRVVDTHSCATNICLNACNWFYTLLGENISDTKFILNTH